MKRKLLLRWIRYHVLFRSLAFLPALAGYRIARTTGYFDSLLAVDSCLAYQHGLGKIFPHLSKKELGKLWQVHCEMMAREILDIFRLLKITSANCERIMDQQGLSVLTEAQHDGQGVILAMGHYGRPTMLSTSLGLAGEKVGMLTQTIDERNPALSSVERGYLAFKMQNTTRTAGGRWVMLGDSLRSLYSGLNAGEIIIILFDLHEANSSKILQVPFLGGKLQLPRGIERIAIKTGARIVYGVSKDKGRRVSVELRALPKDPHEALLAAVAELEKDVAEAPWQWWQWGMLDHIWIPATLNPKP